MSTQIQQTKLLVALHLTHPINGHSVISRGVQLAVGDTVEAIDINNGVYRVTTTYRTYVIDPEKVVAAAYLMVEDEVCDA